MRYLVDASRSRFIAQAFAEGLLSAFGHNPRLAVRNLEGEAEFDPSAPNAASLWMKARADSLLVIDDMSEKDRREIEHKVHELSIALSIVEGATEEAQRRGGVKVNAVLLKLGRLSGVVKEALLFSYGLACEGTMLEGSRLVIEETPCEVFCPNCEVERALTSIQRMRCPVCGEPAQQLEGGREIELVALEIAQ